MHIGMLFYSRLKKHSNLYGRPCMSISEVITRLIMKHTCFSHDFLEGCSKVWLLLIFEHFTKKGWFNWEALEKTIKKFPYKNNHASNRPTLRAKQMKVKGSWRIVGTFAELTNLIQSITQLLFDHVKDTNDPYWLWLIQIRKFLRFMLMPKITDSQVSNQ